MKLDPDAAIPEKKLVSYLLARRPRNDKSAFLALDGYTQSNWEQLQADLRDQILPLEAEFSRSSPYGDLYIIRARLEGPSGRGLQIASVWIVEAIEGVTRFVTFYPLRETADEL